MESLFHKEPPEIPPVESNPYDRIEAEIAHLRKGSSTRHGPGSQSRGAPWLIVLGLFGVLGLYIMDPIFYGWYKSEAVHTYLYLKAYGAKAQTDKLIASKIFTTEELAILDRREGSFQNYYTSADAAYVEAATIERYLHCVDLLHTGKYQLLGPVGRTRYLLFIRTGIPLPRQWAFLNPTVE